MCTDTLAANTVEVKNRASQANNLKSGVPNARFVDLPGAGHFVFLTREADVLRETRTFVQALH